MPSFRLWRRPRLDSEILERAVQVALDPRELGKQPEAIRGHVEQAAEAIKAATIPPAAITRPGQRPRVPKPIDVRAIAQQASRALAPSATTTPADIEIALRRYGLDWAEPFAPGRPLVPYYGYGRRPRAKDYMVGRNVTTETRPDRIPFEALAQVIDNYDIAQTCIRYIINDIRSMPLRWGPMPGYAGDIKRDSHRAAQFWRRPDGNHFWGDWLAFAMSDPLRYDAGALYLERNAAGHLLAVKVIDGTTLAPMLDYYGDIPQPPAPAYQQFIQGVPWDWLTSREILYHPMWLSPQSFPYGVAAIETVLLNANTDVRLQMFFLDFFTSGAVPEMLIPAPKEMSDADSLAEFQETWDDWNNGEQAKRRGARYVPYWDHPPVIYKQIEQIDPKIAEYVMRRTVAAYGLTPQNVNILADVNRATSETQVDQQFRVGSLPYAMHWEAIVNAVTQEELQLPVAAHFDVGREAQDRLMEAQAHQVYVSIGAESPDEVRDKILGLPIDNDNPLPRGYYSQRLGFIPEAYIQSVSGKVDAETYAPTKPPKYVPFTVPTNDVKPKAAGGSGQAAPTGQTAEVGGRDVHQQGGVHSGTRPQGGSPSPASHGGASADTSAAYGRGAKAADVARWRRQSKERVRQGKPPREFRDSAIDQRTYECIWGGLSKAATVDAVDAAFEAGLQAAGLRHLGLAADLSDPRLGEIAKAKSVRAAGIAVLALDTGRVLMIQRDFDDQGKQAAGRWEWPGGRLEPGEDPWTAARREWSEEVGLELPAGEVAGNWTQGAYQGFVYTVDHEFEVNPAPEEVEAGDPDHPRADRPTETAAWWRIEDAKDCEDAQRKEFEDFDWDIFPPQDAEKSRPKAVAPDHGATSKPRS